MLGIHTAKTSSIGEGDYPFYTYTTGGTFVVDNPELGIMRISVNGDSTNAGNISADVSITFSSRPVSMLHATLRAASFLALASLATLPLAGQEKKDAINDLLDGNGGTKFRLVTAGAKPQPLAKAKP